MSTEKSELDALIPEAQIVTVKGEELLITPFKLFDLFKVLKTIFGMSRFITSDMDQMSLMSLIVDNPEEVLTIFKISTKKDAKFFDDIGAEEGLDLIMAIYKVNADFFTKKLAPKFQSLSQSELLNDQEKQDLANEKPPEDEQKIPSLLQETEPTMPMM